MADNNGNIVDVQTLALFFEVDERTIQNWVKDNGAPRLERGEYDFLQFVKWRLNFLSNEIKVLQAGGDRKYTLETEKLAISNKRDMIKLKLLTKELVPIDLIRNAYIGDAIAYKTALDALKNKLFVILQLDDKQRRDVTKEFDETKEQIGTELRISEKEEIEEYLEDEEIEEQTENNKLELI